MKILCIDMRQNPLNHLLALALAMPFTAPPHFGQVFTPIRKTRRSRCAQVMRRAPQPGQNPRFLRLQATSCSAWHCAQEAVLQAATGQVGVEPLLDGRGQLNILLRTMSTKFGETLLDDLVAQCAFRAVAHVCRAPAAPLASVPAGGKSMIASLRCVACREGTASSGVTAHLKAVPNARFFKLVVRVTSGVSQFGRCF